MGRQLTAVVNSGQAYQVWPITRVTALTTPDLGIFNHLRPEEAFSRSQEQLQLPELNLHELMVTWMNETLHRQVI